MKRYIVSTHVGDFETMAVTPRRAIANVRYRLFGRCIRPSTIYWTVQEAE